MLHAKTKKISTFTTELSITLKCVSPAGGPARSVT